jgi:hypothetical protein
MKYQHDLVELERHIFEIKSAMDCGDLDRLEHHYVLEEVRLVRLFLAANIKGKFLARPDSLVIETYQTPEDVTPKAQIAPPAIASLLGPVEPSWIGSTWYIEFVDGEIFPGLQILTPVLWKRMPELRETFGTDYMFGQGCADESKFSAVADLAKERIKVLGALPWIRFTTLGAFRLAYRNYRTSRPAPEVAGVF